MKTTLAGTMVVAVIALYSADAPALEGVRLSPAQLDMVTAGNSSATATATASGSGSQVALAYAGTETATEATDLWSLGEAQSQARALGRSWPPHAGSTSAQADTTADANANGDIVVEVDVSVDTGGSNKFGSWAGSMSGAIAGSMRFNSGF
jgi:hypothetical protein